MPHTGLPFKGPFAYSLSSTSRAHRHVQHGEALGAKWRLLLLVINELMKEQLANLQCRVGCAVRARGVNVHNDAINALGQLTGYRAPSSHGSRKSGIIEEEGESRRKCAMLLMVISLRRSFSCFLWDSNSWCSFRWCPDVKHSPCRLKMEHLKGIHRTLVVF